MQFDVKNTTGYDRQSPWGQATPWEWGDTQALDGTAPPWCEAPLGSTYIYEVSGNVTSYTKIARAGTTADWMAKGVAGVDSDGSVVGATAQAQVFTKGFIVQEGETNYLSLQTDKDGNPRYSLRLFHELSSWNDLGLVVSGAADMNFETLGTGVFRWYNPSGICAEMSGSGDLALKGMLRVGGVVQLPGTVLAVSGYAADPVVSGTMPNAMLTVGEVGGGRSLYGSVYATQPNGFWLQVSSGNDLSYTGSPLVLQPVGGRVGIGVSAPASKLDIDAGAMTMKEMTAPSAPAANSVVIYLVDNGAGKTQLMALFPTGVAQQIAIEPT